MFKINRFLNTKLILIVVLVSFSLVLAGCLPSVSPPDGESKGSGEFVKGEIVKGFPPLPLAPGARVVESYGNGGSYGASLIADDDFEKVVKFYDESLKKLGWDSSQNRQSETNYVFNIKNATYKGLIIVNTAADLQKTAITLSVEPR
jgi:hypothetical protein